MTDMLIAFMVFVALALVFIAALAAMARMNDDAPAPAEDVPLGDQVDVRKIIERYSED